MLAGAPERDEGAGKEIAYSKVVGDEVAATELANDEVIGDEVAGEGQRSEVRLTVTDQLSPLRADTSTYFRPCLILKSLWD